MQKIIIIGAGTGGLAAGITLARAGLDVTVLEAHIYAGGCAGTFFHQGYRFDAGATLAGGFAPGGPMDFIGTEFEIDWQAQPAHRAMQVHLSDGSSITRWSETGQWQAERQQWFGRQAEDFWHWQEKTATVLWDFALRLPPWPPQTARQTASLLKHAWRWQREHRNSLENLAQLGRAAFGSAHWQLPANRRLREYVDAQLLISAQTTSQHANALYAAVALDLARQGVAHLPGGMGSIAEKLTASLRQQGGQIHFRQTAQRVWQTNDGRYCIETKRGDQFLADIVIFNLTPWNVAELMPAQSPARIRRLPSYPRDGWGAFMIYLGAKTETIPPGLALHHQVVMRTPLGEGNSVFISLSPDWDINRAPSGHRAITISTHTRLAPWWQLQTDPASYQHLKDAYTEKILTAAERVIPGLRSAAQLVMPGTPVTFQRFTRRAFGWVGGFPQTSLLRAWGPRLDRNLWLVGDSIFPGQSVPAAALGGMRVAQEILAQKRARFFAESNAAARQERV